jgi:hypothetical protein
VPGPSFTLVEDLLDAARKDGERTALEVAINAVDVLLARSTSLDDFQGRWLTAKALYEEMRVD